MKTDMHANSLAAYKGLNLSKRQKEVLNLFLLYPWARLTDRQVAELLRLEPGQVTGRIHELTKEKGILEECDSVKGKFGVMVRVSRIKPKETLF